MSSPRALGRATRTASGLGAIAIAASLAASCFDRGDRWLPLDPAPPACNAGDLRCTTAVERCDGTGANAKWVVVDDCAATGDICVPNLFECKACIPASSFCDGLDVRSCAADGESSSLVMTCDPAAAQACREGACKDLCEEAVIYKSNVGCEYWAVDLDNADINATSNAAAQQFAVVVSNPQPDVPVTIHIEQDDTDPGELGEPYEIASSVIAPLNLQVFKLGPREVDGSPKGQFNAGTHTALTRHAYRITSDFPIVVYQFNPLENVSVFSNDASLLYPREALDYGTPNVVLNYVTLGWPQTIAITDDPETNFDPAHPINLRAFLTIVGTEPGTHVRVEPSTTVVGGGPVAETGPGGTIEATLDAFDVLNLETGDFNADFSSTLIYSDGPVAVFAGSEASDAPHFEKKSQRRCCADHLEDQVAPIRTAGKVFAVPHTPNRGVAVQAAGADVQPIPEADYVRFIATEEDGATIETSLPAPDDVIHLAGRGAMAEVRVLTDFTAESSSPVLVAQVMGSQQDGSVTKSGYPGGDPSLMFVPPLEQARTDYVFLTPDKYAFDFVLVVAPAGSTVFLDGQELGPDICEVSAADGLTSAARGKAEPDQYVYRCQLGFPTIDGSTDPPKIMLGEQRDGVHRVSANAPVAVSVMGFDAFVSYAYAGGTELREIAPPQ
ncbi:MAG: IgGFc-binding protein [Polyangiaceae bacterium]